MTQKNTPVWLITGCSTGFGRELAKLVLNRGFRAAVTARSPEKIQDLVAGYDDRALAMKLDVTNATRVAAAVREVESTFGGIDVLVNNAGYGLLGAVEESEEQEVRAMFETNFFGLARMIHAVLPGMRKNRKGFIVNISSVGGLVGLTGVGYYNATKFAVEGLSEALAKEVEPMGIKVLIVEPGPFRTDWAGRSIKFPRKEIQDYADTAGARRRMITGNSGKQPGDPARAAQAIVKAVESPNPPLHLVLGRIGLEATREKFQRFQKELDGWEETSLSADFPA
ncbi:MAG: oxidoreductase [Deltaproteobacteria bacterium]|jgi:NAD(P)-dependent dehydrogenase (short-subunit alcohol dehydrogenase family)|nr:oxidoreductase [Deltaproteobacteria bacterium]